MKHLKTLLTPIIITANLLALSLSDTPASAALMQFSFGGDVNTVTGLVNPPITSTHKLSGFFTIESTTSGISAGPNTTQYTNIFKSLTLDVGPLGGPAVMTASLGTGDNSLFVKTVGSNTFYSVLGPLAGSSVNTIFSPIRFEFDGNAGSPPSIGNLLSNANRWRIIFDGTGNQLIAGNMKTITAVPLPTAVVLFGAGLVALAGLGAGSWRQRKNSITA